MIIIILTLFGEKFFISVKITIEKIVLLHQIHWLKNIKKKLLKIRSNHIS